MSSSRTVETPHASEVCPVSAGDFGDVLAMFAHLREQGSVHRVDDGSYVITRYDDIYAATRDPETFSSEHELAFTSIEEADARSVIYSDDPVHLGLRQLVNRALTPRGVAEVGDKVVENANEIVGGLVAGEVFNVVELGGAMALSNFADLLGVARADRDIVRRWMPASAQFVRPAGGPLQPPADVPAFQDGYRAMRGFLESLVAEHAGHDLVECVRSGGLTLFGKLVVEAEVSKPGSLDVILHKLLPPMTAGGTSTVAHIFPNAVDVLMDHPDIWNLLRADPGQLDFSKPSETIEEILRLKSVVPGLMRLTTRDVEVAGTVIPAGSKVQLAYLSGDHDPDTFEDPDEFRARGVSRHLAFGFGTHTCIGQSLVRLELKAFLGALAGKFNHLERVSDPDISWAGEFYYTPNKLPVIGHGI